MGGCVYVCAGHMQVSKGYVGHTYRINYMYPYTSIPTYTYVWLWGDVGKWGFAVGKGGLCVAAGHTVTII